MVSIIIPSRNEVNLERTLRNVLDNAGGDIEIIAELDGWLPDPRIEMNDNRVRFIYHKEGIGQRACINHAVSIAKGKYIMKLDAHCAVDESFDIKLSDDCEYDWTVVPRMYNLDIETFKPKLHKRTDYMYITSPKAEKPFRAMYYGGQQPKNDIMLDETMCCMGPGWFMHKERFLELGGCDENHEGGWGQQGIEVSLKAWLSGGKLIVNKKTWFAHWFRGGGGPGFPYKISGNQINRVRKYSQDLWLNNKWEKQTRTLEWLVDKFQPPGWNMRTDLTILFYSSNRVADKIMTPVVRSLKRHGYPIISVTQEPMDIGKNFVVPKECSLQNIYRQVLRAAKEATTEYVALCEDDCLYTKEHFSHVPKKPFAYNLNRWLLHLEEGVYSYRKRPVLSQCIAHRGTLIKTLEDRFALPEIPDKYCGEMGVFDKKLGIPEFELETFETELPNLVVCHKDNTLRSRKLLGKDAPPRTTLEPYGDVKYWMKKFLSKKQVAKIKDDKPELKKQVSCISGKVYKIEQILNHLEWFWDYRKMIMLPYYHTCLQFFKDVHSGKTFTDEELKEHPYFQYLLTCWSEPSNPKIASRCLFHMRDGIEVYNDIKKNGMMAPIEAWRDEKRNKINIHRGLRRIAIKNALGHKSIAIRLFRDRHSLEKLQGDAQGKFDDTTLHGIAIKQFQKYGYKGTDKFWTHNYTTTYDLHLSRIKDTAKKVLEIGVFNGASLLMWRDFFPNAHIYGADKDISRASMVNGVDRITLLEGNQKDKGFFTKDIIPCGKFDLIVDDCSHIANLQKETLELLWDSIDSGGIYIIEDLHWRGATDSAASDKLKEMISEVNDTLDISSMHFYYNICILEKR